MTAPALDFEAARRIVRSALAEDLGNAGDVTTEALIPAGVRATGRIVARAPLVVAGLPVAAEVFRALDEDLRFTARRGEGEPVEGGAVLAEVRGAARPILTGERTALNFLGRMCGIATAARAAVREVEGTAAVILDTRKTAPGLRVLDKYAVAAGGATNHRVGLYDALMIKDTHVALAGTVGDAVRRILSQGHPPETLTVEVRSEEEMEEAIRAGAVRILLDNLGPTALRRCVERAAGRARLEASGGLCPGGLRATAATGVDFLSVGWLTHSSPAANVALETEVGS